MAPNVAQECGSAAIVLCCNGATNACDFTRVQPRKRRSQARARCSAEPLRDDSCGSSLWGLLWYSYISTSNNASPSVRQASSSNWSKLALSLALRRSSIFCQSAMALRSSRRAR